MTATPLSFSSLHTILDRTIEAMGDPRRPSNATRYSIKDAVLAAFSCFFMQSESFLDYQRQLNSRSGADNAQSLFGLDQIPSVEQIRNILDKLPASGLSSVFVSVYRALKAEGYLGRFKLLGGHILVALDGTEYYSLPKISCPCCSTRTSKKGQVTYAHKALLPVIVSPNQSAVICLPPALIAPQDGHAK